MDSGVGIGYVMLAVLVKRRDGIETAHCDEQICGLVVIYLRSVEQECFKYLFCFFIHLFLLLNSRNFCFMLQLRRIDNPYTDVRMV